VVKEGRADRWKKIRKKGRDGNNEGSKEGKEGRTIKGKNSDGWKERKSKYRRTHEREG
jgi:hypothetical protein